MIIVWDVSPSMKLEDAGSDGKLRRSTRAAELMRARARELGVRWVLYGILEEKRYGPAALARLRESAPVAAAFPVGTPHSFLFDFRRSAPKMENP